MKSFNFSRRLFGSTHNADTWKPYLFVFSVGSYEVSIDRVHGLNFAPLIFGINQILVAELSDHGHRVFGGLRDTALIQISPMSQLTWKFPIA